MQKVYFNNSTLYLTSTSEAETKNLPIASNAIFFIENAREHIDTVIDALQSGAAQNAVLVDSDINKLLRQVKAKFTVIEAAGGLVQTDFGELLLIFRRGKWDMPKGKLDQGETLEDCALREIEEETGLHGGKLGRKIMVTYHTYQEKGQSILKESHWFFVSVAEKQSLQPQTDEDIEQCIWVAPQDLPKYLTNTHPSIADVLHAALGS